ncbi:MAG: hypothetical protein ACLR23_02545 [Clostridia bacterium]
MIVGLMECLVERDPQLRRMKETIGEIIDELMRRLLAQFFH